MQFEDVEFKVRNSQVASKNPVKTMVSKVATPNNVEEKNKYKKILKGITGSIGPGEILALMGPSGSGKTTLLRVVGGRLLDNIKGKITYNDVPYSPALKRRLNIFFNNLCSTDISEKMCVCISVCILMSLSLMLIL